MCYTDASSLAHGRLCRYPLCRCPRASAFYIVVAVVVATWQPVEMHVRIRSFPLPLTCRGEERTMKVRDKADIPLVLDLAPFMAGGEGPASGHHAACLY